MTESPMPPRRPAADPAVLAFLATRLSQPAKLYTPPVPDRPALERILTLALRVPDHGKLEPWRLIVLGRSDLARLADLAEARAREAAEPPALTPVGAPALAPALAPVGAPADLALRIDKGRGQFDRGHLAVAVISSPKASDKVPLAEQILSAGALCMGLVTAATAAGWGANWLTGWPAHDAAFRARAFGCSGAETVAGIIHIGTPGTPVPDRPRPALDRVVRWGLNAGEGEGAQQTGAPA